jgi:hypothetical protein
MVLLTMPNVSLRPGDRAIAAVLAINAQTADVVGGLFTAAHTRWRGIVVGLLARKGRMPIHVKLLAEEFGAVGRATVHALGSVGADAAEVAMFCQHGILLPLLLG